MNGVVETFASPEIRYGLVAPLLIVLGGGVLGVLLEAFLPRGSRRTAQLVLVGVVLVAAFVAVVRLAGTNDLAAEGTIAVDGPALFMQGSILLVAMVSALLMAERQVDPAGDAFAPQASALPGSADEKAFTQRGWLQTEIWPLFLFSVGGMMMFTSANDLLTMFVALEVMSLPLYLMAGMARRRRLLSQEAAMKYFLLGAYSSGFFVFGAAMLYGFSGTITFPGIVESMAADPGNNGLLIAATGLLFVALLFKVGAVPFHQWTPDVYQGAPTPATAFMAAGVKIAAVGALLRLSYVALGGLRWDWRPLMWAVAIATMLVGAIVALTQTDIKRMLAYSAIANAGFMLIGVLATNQAGLSGTMFYLLAYGFSTLGAFAIVTLVRDPAGEATKLSQWAGLGKTSPLIAGAMAILLLAFAGIPLTSGFTSKFAVFQAGIAGGATPVVIVGVIASAIAAFFYVRVIVLMFFTERAEDAPAVVVPSSLTAVAIGVTVAVTVILGVLPQSVLDLADKASTFIR
ncbi:MAG: NADH-quinone oxidoreductase subunit NuoN [Candidatus Nanopelagicales bacterium]|nr:NADH-quinone oxidoreductase subunit NuoN [Candidatus Nanopelagicales bacterium]MCU0296474.1 NADH-quinone oxidoreductase subunit NuoN [Candidatus Nanopelagicales bacterium]MCU0299135.1 NADH-quinone oxidoreductase subunit NuoN [Candidatus Nanopelagicales bacterium]